MLTTPEKVKHPYIVIQQDYCGGSPIITGTKFPVRSVVNYVLKQGMTPEELLKEFSHLTLAQVYDALSYYSDHKTEIEQELSEELKGSGVFIWNRQGEFTFEVQHVLGGIPKPSENSHATAPGSVVQRKSWHRFLV